MKRRQIQYFFGRLNVIAPGRDKRKVLTDGLRQDTFKIKRKHQWGFFEVGISDEGELGQFVHGFLVKFRPQTEEEVVIPETHRLDDATVANRVIAKSRFFLHLASSVIAFHPVGNLISREVFQHRFVELFQEALGQFFVSAEILSIDDPEQLLSSMRRFTHVQELSIYLHPSNPTNRDVWRRTDERLRRLKAGSYEETFEAAFQTGGLEITNDEEVIAKITMAEDGYGKATVTGELDGEQRTVSTHDNPITALAPADEEAPEVALARIATVVRRILERFTA